MASSNDCLGSSVPTDDTFRNPIANMGIRLIKIAKTKNVSRQPIELINCCMLGTNKNIPSDADAIMVPKTILRRSFGTTLLMAPRTSTCVGPLNPNPTSKPTETMNSVDVVQ